MQIYKCKYKNKYSDVKIKYYKINAMNVMNDNKNKSSVKKKYL